MAAWFNEIMTKLRQISHVTVSEIDSAKPSVRRTMWVFAGKHFPSVIKTMIDVWKGGGKVGPWRLPSLAMQWLPARLQRTQNGAGRAGIGRGWGQMGRGARWGEMGTVKTATQRWKRGWGGRRRDRKIIILHPSGLPPLALNLILLYTHFIHLSGDL